MGRAIGACHRGAARTACLADLTRAVRNILGSTGEGARVEDVETESDRIDARPFASSFL